MFKGLKSKLGDEAKRLQANLSQYGENLAQQVRSTASDAGSDIGANTRRFFQPILEGSNPSQTEGASKPTPELQNDLLISLDDDTDAPKNATSASSAIMQVVNEADLLGLNETTPSRQRRVSGGSMESSESTLSSFFANPVVPSFEPMETIASDVESTWNDSDSVSAHSSTLTGASKEQISSVLSKLHGRASSYKDRYQALALKFNEVVSENEKIRNVLTTTQDKVLEKMEKLRDEKKELVTKLEAEVAEKEKLASSGDGAKVKRLHELLEKCKESISANKDKISQLTAEKERLQANLIGVNDDNEITQLAVERVTAEWKGRVDRLEEEWTKRLSDCEEKAAISIATSKAEMHLALEHKDSDIETWMNKCHQLEKADADSNGRWQAKVNSLTAAIAALETEKSDMVEKLSQAKQEGAVREEEMKRRQKLEENFKKTREADAAAANEKMESEIRRVEDEWRLKLKELEEQMQLAIEEREMVKVAALAQQDRKNDEMEVINTQLNEEKIKLQAQLEEIHEKNRRQMQELSSSIETNSTRHKEEISQLNESHQEIVGNMKLAIDSKQAEIDKLLVELESKGAEKIPDGQLEEVSQLVEKLRVKENEVEDLTKKIEDLEKSISAARASFEEDLESEKADGDKRVEEFKSKAEKKIGKMKRQCETDIQAAKAELLLELDEKRSELATKQEEIHQFNLSIALFDTQANELKQLRLDYDKLQASVKEHASLQEQFTVLEKQLSETLDQLREKNEQLKSGVAERNGLHADLVALKQIIDDCETEKQAEIKKAQVKADLDRQRMVRDLQREIKKLYQDLNEKTAALDDANSRLRDLENNSLEKVETVPLNQAQRVSSIEDGPMVEAVDQEELQNLRDRLCQYQKEMAELREKLSREVVKHGNDGRKSPYSAAVATTVATMDMHNMNRQSTATSLPNHCDPSNLSFAEPTEAEYLRNVLYRYMSERETLGKESVTLAKVIGTVAKFSREQLDAVVLKEQARSQGWGGTVQALGQSVLSHASNGHGLS